MTAALSDLHPPPGGWTTDDLDELPEDGHRCELVDGVPIVSPSPIVKLDEPWPIELPISAITPRFYRPDPDA